ncbi:restriction endonuclease subunit S [Bacteroides sp. 90-K9/2]|uniref:restriction endonuclease subunit S n=1 Tax=Bacteroides sp. 90-K9/2 TaxID=3142453 RepID=UPI0039B3C42D
MDTKKLRQKILDLAIRGKLVPQDPNDEPASVLLERIREEKERLIKEGKIKRSKKTASSDTYHYENVPFEVPEGWVWCKLENITVLIEDCPHTTAKDEGKGYPLVRTPNIGEGQLLLDGVHRVSKEVYDKRNVRAVPQVDDIIYAREAPAGNVAVIRENEQVCLGQRTVLIRPMNTLIDSVWLTYTMLAPYSKNHLTSKATGSTVTHVNMASIRPFDLPLPPLSEQHRIVAEIKRWFALIDQIEQGKADLQTIIKQTKSKILGLAIHGKLVPQAPNDEPAIELLKRINPDFTPCDNGHYTQLPDGWTVCRLEQITNYEQPTAYIVNSTTYDDSYSTPVLTAGKSFIIGYTNETAGIYSNLPCIIFDDFTTDSKKVDFPFKVKSSAMKILKIHKDIEINYVTMFMSITRLVGDTHKRYWISEYSKLEIPIPPKAEQKRIVYAVREIFTQLDLIMESL